MTQEPPKKGDLVVSETATSTWNYHLRVIGAEGFKPGGGAPPALCGQPLGWDTLMPLRTWGHRSHIPASYCLACTKIALATVTLSASARGALEAWIVAVDGFSKAR